ncbi:diaminopropionate ammonia-lyase [Roseobacter sp. HKCCD9010]|uniref:diaminopropionate ammonia-lyase n=1 Tax=unclassified Roseobacter TaxID=196798 RepID=UPI0014929D43|nr:MULTISPECIES: diaminopropionate ammonia-lyase [unclassified Roseobacter]MBF9051578.1 diaminopropionate ammonia-lyase [Rhodobacterales bacterium HKCCD4356]NNV13102.1 diaminopropionate ammonia-lyase [Roseobacter sp. HKCCD7357]NNV17353.1 diaminopropionate ammonia-lyase [Roseobacter sp. HKCCD8768]NNV26959.1 diaminopropionate ammonia-lyase [Roseobacter sp. HKCCD8192]NNV31079.1 diaminopropionate ammonia-lyase [Roseobacter sp. HKCCD9061]
MTELLPPAQMQHVAANRIEGDAALRVIPAESIATARAEITQWDGYAPTPLWALRALAERIGVGEILYKDEGPRFGLGSFKALGGAYAAQRVLQREIARRLGRDVSLADIRQGKLAEECAQIMLVSATDGNHGRSLAWGCKRFGAPCRIYIHSEVSEGRAIAMRNLGAEVIRIEGDYDESVRLTKAEAEANGWFVVSDTSWPGYSVPPRDVMSGYGVMTNEIFEAIDSAPTHVFLQGGVGGMAAGIIASFKQHWGDNSPRVIIVEPELAPCLIESARRGEATKVDLAEETLMAGLSCGDPSELAWPILAEEASDFLTIPESLVGPAMRLLAQPLGDDPAIEAGESAVAGLAALITACNDRDLAAQLGLNSHARVLLIGSEGVTDQAIFNRIMEGCDAA